MCSFNLYNPVRFTWKEVHFTFQFWSWEKRTRLRPLKQKNIGEACWKGSSINLHNRSIICFFYSGKNRGRVIAGHLLLPSQSNHKKTVQLSEMIVTQILCVWVSTIQKNFLPGGFIKWRDFFFFACFIYLGSINTIVLIYRTLFLVYRLPIHLWPRPHIHK